jgi:vanillate monooxygenase ferredoxin subunit
MTTLQVRVEQRTLEADGICCFDLVATDGTTLPPFTAGAHIDVHIAPGLVRQYSLCNNPVERHRYRIAVLREPQSRGGSVAMHGQVRLGQTLTIGTPRNLFPLVPAPHTLLVAGGIGVTPLVAMAHTLHVQGQPFELHHCARSANRMAFRNELTRTPFAASVHLHTDDGDPAQRFNAQALLGQASPHTHLYVCGPAGFMDHVLQTARDVGWSDERLHREYFAAAPIDTAVHSAFDVVLARSGKRCTVPPERTVLEVLLDQGVDLPYSCESGVCGTCLTPVLEGVPDHRDSFLTAAERANGQQFLPCCSRSVSPVLVLDL